MWDEVEVIGSNNYSIIQKEYTNKTGSLSFHCPLLPPPSHVCACVENFFM